MVLHFGENIIDIDVERTREFYKKAANITDDCRCQGCRNYEIAVDFLPKEVKDFFDMIGADMKKSPEVYVNCLNEDNTLFYGGFYHICGTIIRKQPDGETFTISENYRIWVEEHSDLLEDNFPLPVIQLEISANIPWVLNEEYSH